MPLRDSFGGGAVLLAVIVSYQFSAGIASKCLA